jgi:hypothetical protein
LIISSSDETASPFVALSSRSSVIQSAGRRSAGQRDVMRIGRRKSRRRQGRRRCVLKHLGEIERLDVLRDITRRVGIGDVLRENALTFVQPRHARAQNIEKRKRRKIHGITSIYGKLALTGRDIARQVLIAA